MVAQSTVTLAESKSGDAQPASASKLGETQPASALKPIVACKCEGKGKGRKLIVCIDGTSNRFGDKSSNVVEFYSHIDKSPEKGQLTYYNSGIGTHVEPSVSRLYPFLKQRLDNSIDLAIAWNFKETVLAAYRWLSDNYQPKDTIYLFGFSRGAYQVRTLAAMIETVGLIFAGNQEQIPFAYQLYADKKKKSGLGRVLDGPYRRLFNTDLVKRRDDLVQMFKKTFSRQGVKVHFIGAWDTVSSVGFFRGNVLELTQTCDHLCYFRHALALDERRVKYLPEYAVAGLASALDGDKGNRLPADAPADRKRSSQPSTLPSVKEVWFPGCHSDIGGGNRANPNLDLRRPSLLWIRHEAMLAGLSLHPLRIPSSGSPAATAQSSNKSDWRDHAMATTMETTESLKYGWWLLEILPFLKWNSYKSPKGYSKGLHLGKGRVILPHQKIHISIHKTEQNYKPSAKFNNVESKNTWNTLLQRNTGDGASFEPWLNRLRSDNLVDLVELAFHDETMIGPLVSHIEEKNEENQEDPLEQLQTLSYFVKYHRKATLETRNLIPTLCSLRKNGPVRDELLIQLAKHPEDSVEGEEVSYEDAVSKALLNETTKKQVRDVHLHMLQDDSFVCGAKGLSSLAKHDNIELKDTASQLIQKLKLDEPKYWATGADTLADLARHDDCVQEIQVAKLFPLIIGWLASNDSTKIKRGTTVLSALVKQDKLWHLIVKEVPMQLLVNGLLSGSVRHQELFGGVFKSLATHENGLQAIKDNNVITRVMDLLGSKYSFQILRGATGLRFLTGQDRLRVDLLNNDPIPYLAAGLGCYSHQTQEACGFALYDLAQHEDGRREILHARAIPSIMDLLKSKNHGKVIGGVCGLYYLVDHDEVRAKILAQDPMKHFVTGLASSSVEVRSYCGRTLWDLAKHEDGRRAILDARVVNSTMDLLRSKDQGKILGGAIGLYYLADQDGVRAEILAQDPMPHLVAGLGCYFRPIQVACGDTLRDLAQHEDGRQGILDARVVRSVMDLLKSKDQGKVFGGAIGLYCLVDHDEVRASMLAQDPMRYLMDGLDSSSGDARIYCGRSLRDLAKHEDAQREISHARVIPSIMALLKSRDQGKILSGAYALGLLADNDEVRTKILAGDTIQYLLAGLASSSDETRRYCGWAFGGLAKHEDGLRAIIHAIPLIVDLLKSKDQGKILSGAIGLKVLVDHDDLRAIILDRDPMPFLIAGLNDDSESVQTECAWVLEYIAQHDDGRKAILDAQVIPSVMKMLKSEDVRKIVGGARGLSALVDFEKFRSELLEASPIPLLHAGLSCHFELARSTCAWTVGELAKYDDGWKAIVDAQLIPSFVDAVKSEDPVELSRGANGLNAMAERDELRAVIIEGNPMPSLISGLGCASHSVQTECGWALSELIGYEDCQKSILDAGVVPMLVGLLDQDVDKKTIGARGLYILAEADIISAAIRETNAIPRLTDLAAHIEASTYAELAVKRLTSRRNDSPMA